MKVPWDGSFILTDEYRMNRIYLSSLSTQTLLSRIQGCYNKNE